MLPKIVWSLAKILKARHTPTEGRSCGAAPLHAHTKVTLGYKYRIAIEWGREPERTVRKCFV